ncbi:MAG: T9SS type A sorting domain-containing protein, partial [Candidatus Krumholzibacteria bacterium]|nr:T9SS type A sorting domain-containing protein [Candidatus Krumholzibacteria bacterium]
YEIKEPVHVRLQIFNVQGRLVRTLVDSKRNPGKHDAIWNGLDDVGRPAVSGIYFYRLVAGDFVQTKKMVLLR